MTATIAPPAQQQASWVSWAPQHPVAGRLVFVAGTGPQRTTDDPSPAVQHYLGGPAPALHARIGDSPAHLDRVRVLSAEHGVLRADEPVRPYFRALTRHRINLLRPLVNIQLANEVSHHGMPHDILVLAGPPFLELLLDLFWMPDHRPRLHWTAHPDQWAYAAQLLDRWGWP